MLDSVKHDSVVFFRKGMAEALAASPTMLLPKHVELSLSCSPKSSVKRVRDTGLVARRSDWQVFWQCPACNQQQRIWFCSVHVRLHLLTSKHATAVQGSGELFGALSPDAVQVRWANSDTNDVVVDVAVEEDGDAAVDVDDGHGSGGCRPSAGKRVRFNGLEALRSGDDCGEVDHHDNNNDHDEEEEPWYAQKLWAGSCCRERCWQRGAKCIDMLGSWMATIPDVVAYLPEQPSPALSTLANVLARQARICGALATKVAEMKLADLTRHGEEGRHKKACASYLAEQRVLVRAHARSTGRVLATVKQLGSKTMNRKAGRAWRRAQAHAVAVAAGLCAEHADWSRDRVITETYDALHKA